MTDERTLLLAVADAAHKWVWTDMTKCGPQERALSAASHALTAYRSHPNVDEPKTVEVRGVVVMSPGGKYWTLIGSNEWDDAEAERVASEYAVSSEVRAAVIVAHVMPPTAPVVTGSVET